MRARLRLAAAVLASAAPFASAADGPPQPPKEALLLGKLQAAIETEDRRLDGVMGVAILDLATGRTISQNADEVFAAASSIKIAVLAELYRQERDARAGTPGKARLGDLYTVDARDVVDGSAILAGLTPGVTRVTNRDLATFMMAVSDNGAANVLIERLGMENVNALCAALGLGRTRLRRRMMDVAAAHEGRENTSTPREMVALLAALHEGKLLGAELGSDLLRLLSTRKPGYLTLDLPDDVRVAGKWGDLEGVRTDSCIVFGKRPFAISVMTGYVSEERSAERAIGRIGLAAWRCFESLGRASEFGRVVSPR